MCLRVTGPLRAMKCPSSEPVFTMVPTPLLHSAGVGQLGAAQVDLLDKLKDLLPPETKLGPSMCGAAGQPRQEIAGAAPGRSE